MRKNIHQRLLIIALLLSGTINLLAQENVTWVNRINTQVEANNHLAKRSTYKAWNAGAATANIISSSSNGWFEVKQERANTYWSFGLSKRHTGVHYADIDYAIYIARSSVYIYENGVSRGRKTTASTSDLLRVERIGNTVYYKKNNQVFYTSTIPSSSDLVGSVAMFDLNVEISNAFMSEGVNTAVEPTQQASNTTVTDLSDNGATISWNAGNGQRRLVVVNPGDDTATIIKDGNTILNPNTTYGLGQSWDGFQYLVFDGDNSTSSVSIDGLLAGQTYTATVIEYNTQPEMASNFLTNTIATTTFTTSGGLQADQPVTWVDVSGLRIDGQRLIKTSRNSVWGNSGAFSLNQIPAYSDGKAQMIIDRNNLLRVFGLSNTNKSLIGDMDYAIYLRSNQTFIAYENGYPVTAPRTYKKSDKISFVRSGELVYYLHNDEICYISKERSYKSLAIDLSFNINGNSSADEYSISEEATDLTVDEPTIAATNFSASNIDGHKLELNWTKGDGNRRVVIGSTTPITTLPADGHAYENANPVFGQGRMIGNNVTVLYDGTDASQLTVFGLKESSTYHFAIFEYNTQQNLRSNSLRSNFLTSDYTTLSATTTGDGLEGEDINWTDLVGVSVDGSKLTNTTSGWGSSGAASANTIAAGANGWVEMVSEGPKLNSMFGFSSTNASAHHNTIEHAIFFSNDRFFVHEKGKNKGTFGSYNTGDTFRVERGGGAVYYSKNDEVFYISQTLSFASLVADVALHTNGVIIGSSKIYSGQVSEGRVPDAIELDVLKDIYTELNGDGWINKTNWPAPDAWPVTATSGDFQDWFGIKVTNGDISHIELPLNNLEGELPNSLGLLESLKILTLNNNSISGDIPDGITNLTDLTNLYLNNNLLTGSIPSDIGKLTKLGRLQLNNNQLTGLIPSSIGALSRLYYLFLQHNQLIGAIPYQIGDMNNLTYLYLYDNQLSERIPYSIGNLSKLKHIYFYNNNLSGNIPTSIGELSRLEYLQLHNNELSGEIPVELGNLYSLNYLHLLNNKLTGTLPESLGNLKLLTTLIAADNELTGAVPEQISQLHRLNQLILKDNFFTSIPQVSLVNRGKLRLDIAGNYISYSTIEANLNEDGTHDFQAYSYSPQGNAPIEESIVLFEGEQLTIDSKDASINNTFQWEKQNESGDWIAVNADNEFSSGDKFEKGGIASEDAGYYRYTVTNGLLNATKTSEQVEVVVKDPKEDFLSRWAFQYKYDDHQRMVEKKVPGAGWVYMVYDKRDRLVMSQDANQRESNEWIFTKYDYLNRPVLTGKYVDDTYTSREAMQAAVDAFYTTAQAYEVRLTDAPTSVHGYSNVSFPQVAQEDDYLTALYYDDYNIPFATEFEFVADASLGLQESFDRVKGQLTAQKAKVLNDSAQWLEHVNYYDNRYRITQVQSRNIQGTIDVVSNQYDFQGNLLKTTTTHKDIVVRKRYNYDHANRLLNTYHQLDSAEEVLLSSNAYNELGQLIEKNLHSEDDGASFAQSVDYRYNIRGWLTKINDADLSEEETLAPNDYFGMELGYDNPLSGIGNQSLFNGNISGVKWSNSLITEQRGYSYHFDEMERIKKADYYVKNELWQPSQAFALSGVQYDLNGNILALTRTDGQGTEIDKLTYDYGSGRYRSNKLLAVTDQGDLARGFKDGIATQSDFSYDLNGNIIEDLNKGIDDLGYNYINLQSSAVLGEAENIRYIYDATGVKHAQVQDNDGYIIRTDYIGRFVYQDANLETISHTHGKLKKDGFSNEWEYQYDIKDHLGNPRVSFTGKPDVYDFILNFENDPELPDDIDLFEATSRIIPNEFFDHTDEGGTNYNHSQNLNGSENGRVGSIIAIPVLQGDILSAEVFAKYVEITNDPAQTTNAIGSILLGAFANNFQTSNEFGNQTLNNNFGAGALIGSPGFPVENENAPMAFLNIIFLPDTETINLENGVTFAFDQIDVNATQPIGITTKNPFDHLLIEGFEAPKAGYVMVYLSNESNTLVDVHFDDLKITLNQTSVIQTDDHYPFGLSIAENAYDKENPAFRGLVTTDGLGVKDLGFRQYDPILGRFNTLDPFSEIQYSESLFQYAGNDPIGSVDVLGLFIEDLDADKKNKESKEDRKARRKANRAAKAKKQKTTDQQDIQSKPVAKRRNPRFDTGGSSGSPSSLEKDEDDTGTARTDGASKTGTKEGQETATPIDDAEDDKVKNEEKSSQVTYDFDFDEALKGLEEFKRFSSPRSSISTTDDGIINGKQRSQGTPGNTTFAASPDRDNSGILDNFIKKVAASKSVAKKQKAVAGLTPDIRYKVIAQDQVNGINPQGLDLKLRLAANRANDYTNLDDHIRLMNNIAFEDESAFRSFWNSLWQNGLLDPYIAGFIEGGFETIGSIYDFAWFIYAWQIVKINDLEWFAFSPIGFGTDFTEENLPQDERSKNVREQTRDIAALIIDLLSSQEVRDELWEQVGEQFDDYFDNLTEDTIEARHLRGKLIFDVVSLFFGIGEVNALLKGQKLTFGIIGSIKSLPKNLTKFTLKLKNLGLKVKRVGEGVFEEGVTRFKLLTKSGDEIGEFTKEGLVVGKRTGRTFDPSVLDDIGSDKLDNALSHLDNKNSEKFLVELSDPANNGLRTAIKNDPSLAKAWNKLDEAGLDQALKSDPDVLKALNKIDCN